jgi:isopenicillin N synthase-like dioxygenase
MNPKVTIPNDCLAFQVGETTQLISREQIRATRHRVQKGNNCRRYTFAVFMSPSNDYLLNRLLNNIINYIFLNI